MDGYFASILQSQNLTALIVFMVVYLLFYYGFRRLPNLPPGPPIVFPFIGNLPWLIGKDPRKVFRSMREQYGDVFCLYIGGRPMVVLNGYSTIKNAFYKKGSVFSERPSNVFIEDPRKGLGVIFSAGDAWKEMRRFTVNALNEVGFTGQHMESRISEEIGILLRFFESRDGEDVDVETCVQVSLTNNILGVLCSKRYDYNDKKILNYIKRLMEITKMATLSGVLVNCFPFIKNVPGDPIGFNAVLENVADRNALVHEIYKEHVQTFDKHNIRDFMDLFIVEIEKNKGNKDSLFTLDQLYNVVNDLLGAGSETTVSALRWALFHFLKFPDTQTNLRTYISGIVGQEAVPRLDDRCNLPYVDAFILEVLRFYDVVPLGVPHSVPEDISFQGFTIPKDCSILANLDTVCRDQNIWGDPDTFRPERFLDSDGCLKKSDEFIPFGIGRRACLGEYLAKLELFMTISAIVQKFVLLPPEPDMDLLHADEPGLMEAAYRPKPFLIRISKPL